MTSAEQVAISGAVKEYLKIADSGNERVQEFCDNCGSQISPADPAKTLFMVLAGCFSQHDQLALAKHIFGKSTASLLSAIEDQQWMTEGLASAEMTLRGLVAQRLELNLIFMGCHSCVLVGRRVTGLVGHRLADAVKPIDDRIGGAFDLTGRHYLPSY